jgi:WD40 repeat protein
LSGARFCARLDEKRRCCYHLYTWSTEAMDSPPTAPTSPADGDAISSDRVYLRAAETTALQAALLNAFDLSSLEQMVTVEFDRSLATIVPVRERNLTDIVFDLVQWAVDDENVGVQRLLQGAVNNNPSNPALKTLQAQWAGIVFVAAASCPYPGMTPFAETDRDRFYGRDAEIKQATQLLRLHPFLTVIGSSGSGKSSLVFAGIIPAMRKATFFGREKLRVYSLRPGKLPLEVLAQALGCGDATPQNCLTCAKAIAAAVPTLVIVDQFEETFTSADKEQAASFQAVLAQFAAIPKLFLILTVRADFYPDLMSASLWGQIQNHRLEVTALAGDGLRAAVAQPAAQVGVTVEPGLVEMLVAEAAGEPGALPFVQETLVLLWDSVRRHTLTLASYEALTGKDGGTGISVAMASRADMIYKALSPDGKRIARRVFLRLVQFGEGRPDTRRQQTEADLQATADESQQFEAVLAQLIDHRLLTSDSAEAVPTRKIDIAHEALLSGWPALRSWIDDRRRMELRRRRLEAKAEEWRERGAGAAALLDEVELREAGTWLASDDAKELGYSLLLTELVAASQADLEEKRRQAEALQQRELEQARALAETQRLRSEEHQLAVIRQRKRTYLALAFGVIALAFAVAALWFAIESNANSVRAENNSKTAVAERAAAQAASTQEAQARQAAEQSQQEAVAGYSRQLAAQALGLVDTRLDLAALLALEAGRIADTAEARQSLLAAVTTNPAFQYILYGDGSALADVKVAPAEDLVAVAGNADGSIALWNLQDGKIRQRLVGHPARTTTLSWRKDGAMLASGDRTGNVYLWQFAPGGVVSETLYAPTNPFGGLYAIRSLQFSPDGTLLAAGGCHTPGATGRRTCEEGEVRIWEVTTAPAPSIVLTDHVDSVTALAFSADGALLATGGCARVDNEKGECRQGAISLLSAADGWTKVRTLVQPGGTGAIVGLAFDPANPGILASGSADGVLNLWDTASGELLASRPEANNRVTSVVYSPDGSMLASTECGRLIVSSLANTRCAQAKMQIWLTEGGALTPYLEFAGHTGWATALSFTPDGRRLISGGDDGNLYVWDDLAWPSLAEPVWYPGVVSNPQAAAQSVAYSPDGEKLAIGACLYQNASQAHCTQSTITLLELASDQPSAEIQNPDTGIDRLTFNDVPEARQLAAAGCEQVDADGECSGSRITLWSFDRDWSYRGETLGHVASTVTALGYAKGGGRLAVGDDDGMVTVWDTNTKQPIFPSIAVDSDQVRSVSFSPDGAILAAAGRDGNIVLLDTTSGQQLVDSPLRLTGSESSAMAIFSPITSTLLLASGGAYSHPVSLWTIQRAGNRIAASTVRLGDSIVGIADIAFSSDGSLLASADMAPEFTLWDVAKQRRVGPTLAEGTTLQRLNFSIVYDIELRPDGKQLATVVADSEYNNPWVLLWDTDPASWARRACWRANRPGLTPAEKQQYLGADAETRVLCP